MTTPTPSATPAGQPTPTAPAEPPKPAPPVFQAPETKQQTTHLPAADLPKGDEFKSEDSKRAVLADLAKEREARKALQGQVEALAPLQKLAEALGATGDPAKGPTEIEQITERLAKHEEELAGERQARWRAEVAHEKGLTPQQADRLRGSTREELAADAVALKELFAVAPGTPRPDPSQGSQGGSSVDFDALIAEANKKGDVREAIRLKTAKNLASKK